VVKVVARPAFCSCSVSNLPNSGPAAARMVVSDAEAIQAAASASKIETTTSVRPIAACRDDHIPSERDGPSMHEAALL
jgi:hypothetical protein